MSRVFFCALVTSTFLVLPAFAEPLRLDAESYADGTAAPIRVAAAQSNLGGGFFEFLFGGGEPRSRYAPSYRGEPYAARDPMARSQMDSRFLPQTVAYEGPEKAG